MGSRNQEVTDRDFGGFTKYAREHAGIVELLKDYPAYRLYWEWLRPHTIKYRETAYNKWYMFDIFDGKEFLHTHEVDMLAKEYGIWAPHLFWMYYNPSAETLESFVWKSELWPLGEGIVIRNYEFVNKFWDSPYSKLVSQDFKESNALTFGGNNKHSESYWEMYVCNKYATAERVNKIINKIEQSLDRKILIEDTPRICWTVLHDIITEEAYEIFKKVPKIDNFKLKQLIMKKTAKIFKDILDWFNSVAYETRISDLEGSPMKLKNSFLEISTTEVIQESK